MFLTNSEIRYFQVFGSAVVEATAMSLTASMSYSLLAYHASKPYIKRTCLFIVWIAAFTVAMGMVARDAWESVRPQVMARIDQIVDSGYSKPDPDPEPITEPEPVTEPEPEIVLPIAAKTMKSAIAVVPLTPKRGIRELRLEAKARGIKGASRMNLQQLAEHGICK